MSQPTVAQQSAIDARGNVLVVAGAGAGKTSTLVERCLAWLMEDPEKNGLDQILMVTFTEAAGAEMRKRLRTRLEKLAENSPRWAEQLALLETAHICTLHSFCFRLVRQHFYELGLDPQLLVLQDDQSRLLARKAMDAILEQHYSDETPLASMVQDLIQEHGRGWDRPVRELVNQIHEYTQTSRDPEAWFAQQFKILNEPEPTLWRQWLLEALQEWRNSWHQKMLPLTDNPNAQQCVNILGSLPANPTREQYAIALAQIIDTNLSWPHKRTVVLRAQIEKIFAEAEFLHSLCAVGKTDPLTEDWNWVRPQMLALLELAQQFETVFTREKRELGGLDFHDLEQFAKRLLWDSKKGRPSALAEHWRKKLRLIFVDEYQDINAAQDAIIQALGGEAQTANRFLVGDVKQSIYRFRLANPRIFLDYEKQWRNGANAKVISLSENFRSHEGVLDFVNDLFGVLMRRDVGGIEYDEAAQLQFGNRSGRAALTRQPQEPPPVELHVLLPAGDEPESQDQSLSDVEKEARWVAGRLLELKNQPALVMEGTERRPCTWNDMVILLRSPRSKVEAYVKEFTRLGVPLTAARGGFYESLEVRDLLSLLELLDNPLQDYPLLAVLRSPLGGFSADDLATIRAAQRKGRFWTALVHWHEVQGQAPEAGAATQPLFERVDGFLKRFYAWRRSIRHLSLSQCLERVLNETHYAEWLLTQERGAQRQGNVERLLQMTRQFDVFQREGLFRFLKFVQAQQDVEFDVEPAAPPAGQAVRLMSIHQSKGLEFPIVVLADLGKAFNMGDLHGKIILDEELGLCPQVKPPQARQFYPSLPFWMAQRRQRSETYGEELRLLYVALTRAAERLILVGTARGQKTIDRWESAAACSPSDILAGKSVLDWVGAWMAQRRSDLSGSGANALVTWTFHEEPANPETEATVQVASAPTVVPTEAQWIELRERFEKEYPAQAATTRPAKVSVSSLRREIEEEEEAAPLFQSFPRGASKKNGKLSAAETGSAHHAFLEMVSLDHVGSVAELKAEAERLCREQRLTSQEVASLDLKALAQFWSSEVGQLFLARRSALRRELPFTTRFGARELEGLSKTAQELGEEFIVVQGVIDLAAILPSEIWLLDFKTDRVNEETVEEKVKQYRPQLELYSRAITAIYRKPVTRSWLYFLSGGITKSVSL